jgi:hypothetical protein
MHKQTNGEEIEVSIDLKVIAYTSKPSLGSTVSKTRARPLEEPTLPSDQAQRQSYDKVFVKQLPMMEYEIVKTVKFIIETSRLNQ